MQTSRYCRQLAQQCDGPVCLEQTGRFERVGGCSPFVRIGRQPNGPCLQSVQRGSNSGPGRMKCHLTNRNIHSRMSPHLVDDGRDCRLVRVQRLLRQVHVLLDHPTDAFHGQGTDTAHKAAIRQSLQSPHRSRRVQLRMSGPRDDWTPVSKGTLDAPNGGRFSRRRIVGPRERAQTSGIASGAWLLPIPSSTDRLRFSAFSTPPIPPEAKTRATEIPVCSLNRADMSHSPGPSRWRRGATARAAV